MELGIRNFTEAGNNLMWRKGWESFQKEHCKSKSYSRMENKVHYDRIFNALTDNRSIDIRVDKSLESVRKMPEKEFIVKYVNEFRDRKTPVEIAIAIAVVLDVPVEDTSAMRLIFNSVMEELKRSPPVLAEVSIAIDDRPVEIIASEEGVKASENPFSFTGIPSVVIDEISGERGITVWEGDNQAPVRGINPTDAGFRMTEVPAQFSVPTRLPPPVEPVRYNRQAIPNTNEIPSVIRLGPITREAGLQTDSEGTEYYGEGNRPYKKAMVEGKKIYQGSNDYPMSPVEVDESLINIRSVARDATTFGSLPKRNKITQTLQTGSEGMLTTQQQRNEFPRGGYSYSPPSRGSQSLRASVTAVAESGRTPSGVRIFSPTGPFSLLPSGENSGTITP